jgi:phosphomannomutase
MKIVVDSATALPGPRRRASSARLGCEVIELFSEVDGNFPNHHPDPSKPDNLRDVIRALQDTDAELGLALTATATAWASSPRTARTSTPTAR